jgi:hypothetical protein
MLNTVRAIVQEGSIRLLEEIELPDGTPVLVTPLIDASNFWFQASEQSLAAVWENEADDAYAELLTK